ncbi:hypothetical protein XENOCAPTIV_014951, partial [Xenoophorus captivus]
CVTGLPQPSCSPCVYKVHYSLSVKMTKPIKETLFLLDEKMRESEVIRDAGRVIMAACVISLALPGVSLAANQEDETDTETFQMEFDRETKMCTFRTSQGYYWALVDHGGIQSTATEVSANTMFSVEWLSHKVAIKASNGKYICTKKNGQLLAVSDTIGDFLSLFSWISSPLTQTLTLAVLPLLYFSRRGRAAHFETDQPAHADPQREQWVHLPPQELQHAGC